MTKMYNVRCRWLYTLYINVSGEANDESNFDKIGVFSVPYATSSMCNDEGSGPYMDTTGDGSREGGV